MLCLRDSIAFTELININLIVLIFVLWILSTTNLLYFFFNSFVLEKSFLQFVSSWKSFNLFGVLLMLFVELSQKQHIADSVKPISIPENKHRYFIITAPQTHYARSMKFFRHVTTLWIVFFMILWKSIIRVRWWGLDKRNGH